MSKHAAYFGNRFLQKLSQRRANRHVAFPALAGDQRSSVGVVLADGIGLTGVESAKIGVFGIELGAGLTVPLGGQAGSIFVDASYGLYSEYSNLNASVGYRLSF